MWKVTYDDWSTEEFEDMNLERVCAHLDDSKAVVKIENRSIKISGMWIDNMFFWKATYSDGSTNVFSCMNLEQVCAYLDDSKAVVKIELLDT